MDRPRKINFPFLMLTLLFLLTQTAFAISSNLSYDKMNGNVQGNQTKEENNFSIEYAKANALDYLISERTAAIATLSALQEDSNITPADDFLLLQQI